MKTLPPPPSGVRLLTNEESDRLRARYPDLPPSPDQCVTCRGKGEFRWWYADADGTRSVETYKCDCTAQWIMHRYLLHCGIGLSYQRLCWMDVNAEPGAVAKVRNYLDQAEAYVAAGCGLILHGKMGTGKTLLSTLLLKALIAAGYDGYFTTFSEMLDTFMSAYRDKDEKQWFYRRVKNAGVLVLDDLGREHHQQRFVSGAESERTGAERGMFRYTTPVAESTFDEVLRHRVAQSKPTVITTNLDLDGVKTDYGANIISLLRERSTTYRFTGEDFREQARLRLDEEVSSGLMRPVVIG